jgi:hypothetical protein
MFSFLIIKNIHYLRLTEEQYSSELKRQTIKSNNIKRYILYV